MKHDSNLNQNNEVLEKNDNNGIFVDSNEAQEKGLSNNDKQNSFEHFVFDSSTNASESRRSHPIIDFGNSKTIPYPKQKDIVLDSDPRTIVLDVKERNNTLNSEHKDVISDAEKRSAEKSSDGHVSKLNKDVFNAKESNNSLNSEQQKDVISDAEEKSDGQVSKSNKTILNFDDSITDLDTNRLNDILDARESNNDLNAKISEKVLNDESNESISITKLNQNDLSSSYLVTSYLDAKRIKLISDYVENDTIIRLNVIEWCTLYNYQV